MLLTDYSPRILFIESLPSVCTKVLAKPFSDVKSRALRNSELHLKAVAIIIWEGNGSDFNCLVFLFFLYKNVVLPLEKPSIDFENN